MTKHTERDLVWNEALQRALNEESFKIDEIANAESVDVATRKIRDTLNTLSDLGWLSKEKEQSHEWNPGPLVKSPEKYEQDSGGTPDVVSLEGIKRKSHLEEGEVYCGTVDRCTGGGNAIISLPEGHLNLGPIDESAVGEEVRFIHVTGVWVECLDEEYTYEGYQPRDGESEPDINKRGSRGTKQGEVSKVGGRARSTQTEGTITDSDPDNKNKLLKRHL